MPEDLPKAVVVLLWLLSGTIIFGWLLMASTVLNAVLFAVAFFGLPVIVYQLLKQKRQGSK
jgi:hypothetical protein